MYKLYCFLAGPAGTSPFVADGQPAANLLRAYCKDACGYVQTRALDEQLEVGAEPLYRGAAELWFREPEIARSVRDAAEDLAPLWAVADVRLAGTLLGAERVVTRLPEHHRQPGVKVVFPFRRRADLSVTAFAHHWWVNHGPIAAQTENALAYFQFHPLHEDHSRARDRGADPQGDHYDGVTELHFPSIDAARKAMASRQMREDQASDAANFVERDSVQLFVAEEERVIAA